MRSKYDTPKYFHSKVQKIRNQENVEIGTSHDGKHLPISGIKITEVGEIKTWISWGIIEEVQFFFLIRSLNPNLKTFQVNHQGSQ